MTMRATGILARALNTLRRFSSRIQPYAGVVLILTTGALFLIGLYTGQIPVTTTPPPERPHLAPPSVERIVTLMVVLASLTMSFIILKTQWDCQTQPVSMRININIRLGFVKCLAILTVAMSMSSGLDLLIRSAQVHSTASTLDLGIIAAVLLTLYGPTKMLSDRTSSFEDLHDIVKDFIFGLLFLVVMVNILVTIPAVFPPLLQMILIAIIATISDGLLSLIPANWNKIASTIMRHLET